jgi:hypothetical protein
MQSKIYGHLEYRVNRIQHHNGQPPEPIPAMKAFVAAWLFQNGALGIDTVTKATVATGVSRAAIDNALTIIEADQAPLASFVLTGRETLSRGARKVRSQARLISAFKKATPDDRIALGLAVGADLLFDDVVTPALAAE